jgi:hypothetical protein
LSLLSPFKQFELGDAGGSQVVRFTPAKHLSLWPHQAGRKSKKPLIAMPSALAILLISRL